MLFGSTVVFTVIYAKEINRLSEFSPHSLNPNSTIIALRMLLFTVSRTFLTRSVSVAVVSNIVISRFPFAVLSWLVLS